MDRVSVDSYVLDTLMRDLVGHDRRPSAFVVYLFLWRRLAAARRGTVHLSLQTMAEATGLSKSAVQSAVRVLERRRLIGIRRASATATPEFSLRRHWRS